MGRSRRVAFQNVDDGIEHDYRHRSNGVVVFQHVDAAIERVKNGSIAGFLSTFSVVN